MAGSNGGKARTRAQDAESIGRVLNPGETTVPPCRALLTLLVGFVAPAVTAFEVPFSSYLGWAGDELPTGLDFTPNGGLVIVGTTESADFPNDRDLTTAAPAAGLPVGCVVRLSDDLGARSWSALLPIMPNAVAVGSDGSIYIAGYGFSGFNSTVVALQGFDSSYSGGSGVRPGNAVIVRLSADGTLLTGASWFGNAQPGTNSSIPRAQAQDVALRRDGTVVISGITEGAIVVAGDGSTAAGGAGYLACFGANLRTLSWATRVGGSLGSRLRLAVDEAGSVYTVGYAQVSSINQDPFVFKSTAAGGSAWRVVHANSGADERGEAVGLGADGTPWVAYSVDGNQPGTFAATPGAFQPSYGTGGGPRVSFLARLDPATGAIGAATYWGARLQNNNTNTLVTTSVAVLPDGTPAFAGRSASGLLAAGDPVPFVGGSAGKFATFSPDATQRRMASYAAGAEITQLRSDGSGRLALISAISAAGLFDAGALQSSPAGGQDFAIIVLDFSAPPLTGWTIR